MAELSAQAIRDLQAQLNAAVAQAAAAPPAAAAAAAAAPGDFCAAYKTARPILEAAANLLPIFLPGLGTTVAAAIKALMTVADKVCPPT
jgi:hypothetical protein